MHSVFKYFPALLDQIIYKVLENKKSRIKLYILFNLKAISDDSIIYKSVERKIR